MYRIRTYTQVDNNLLIVECKFKMKYINRGTACVQRVRGISLYNVYIVYKD